MKSVVGFIVAGIVLLVLLLAANKNSAVPSNLGVKEGMLAPLPYSPNAVSSQTDSGLLVNGSGGEFHPIHSFVYNNLPR